LVRNTNSIVSLEERFAKKMILNFTTIKENIGFLQAVFDK
jgi:hypothetical protein